MRLLMMMILYKSIDRARHEANEEEQNVDSSSSDNYSYYSLL